MHAELRVGQPEAEWEAYLFIESCEISVADVYALVILLFLHIAVHMAVCVVRGAVLIAHCPSVGKFSAWRNLARKNIGECIAALHATLPEEQKGIDMYIFGEVQIYRATAVDDEYEFFVVRREQF